MRKVTSPLKIIFLFLFISSSFASNATSKPRICFLSPDPENTENGFWKNMISFFYKASSELDFKSYVFYSKSSRYSYLKDTVQMSESGKCDYAIVISFATMGKRIVEILNNKKIKTFVINTQFFKDDLKMILPIREKYPNFIGHFYPDDFQAGYMLGECLIENVNQAKVNNKEIIALTGTQDSSPAFERINGLKNKLSENKKYSLKYSTFGEWTRKRGYEVGKIAQGRYPEVRIYWNASDSLALGVNDSIKENSKDSYVFGGIDWSPEALKVINSTGEDLYCSVGGHFLELALASVVIFDYHFGIDFKDDLGLTFKTPFFLADKKNVKKIIKFIKNKSINFEKISKKYNPRSKYDFYNHILTEINR